MVNLTDQIKFQILHVSNKILFNDKKRVFELKGTSLYPSEVHLLLVIENDLGTNATKIAGKLGLTKGAVSQTLSRLERKGIIKKTKDPYNKNELTITLTKFGKEAFQICESTKASFLEAQDPFLSKLTSKEKEMIINFLQHIEQTINR